MTRKQILRTLAAAAVLLAFTTMTGTIEAARIGGRPAPMGVEIGSRLMISADGSPPAGETDPVQVTLWMKSLNKSRYGLEIDAAGVFVRRQSDGRLVGMFALERTSEGALVLSPGESGSGAWERDGFGRVMGLPCGEKVVGQIYVTATTASGGRAKLPLSETPPTVFVCAP